MRLQPAVFCTARAQPGHCTVFVSCMYLLKAASAGTAESYCLISSQLLATCQATLHLAHHLCSQRQQPSLESPAQYKPSSYPDKRPR